MTKGTVLSSLAALSISLTAAEKPRIFITESQALQLSGETAVGETKGALSFTGGTSPQNVEVMKNFAQRCPDVTVTSNPDRADYIVRFDHEGTNPTTPFVRGNKIAIFNRHEDLVYSGSTRLLRNAVKDACAVLVGQAQK